VFRITLIGVPYPTKSSLNPGFEDLGRKQGALFGLVLLCSMGWVSKIPFLSIKLLTLYEITNFVKILPSTIILLWGQGYFPTHSRWGCPTKTAYCLHLHHFKPVSMREGHMGIGGVPYFSMGHDLPPLRSAL
jgi:hypothetical protein